MAYLFTHFTSGEKGDREHIWFSVSRDGLNWIDLGGDEPYLTCEKGTTGIRDPFIVYDEKLKKYFIIEDSNKHLSCHLWERVIHPFSQSWTEKK